MIDHDSPTTRYDAERQGLTAPDELPHSRVAVDNAMAAAGFGRELRYRESDMVEQIARAHLAMRLKLGHTDNRSPGPEVFREAMALGGYLPTERHNARALGRRLGDVWVERQAYRRGIEAARAEIARLRALLPPAGDEPTDEAPTPGEAFNPPHGLTVTPLNPRSPAAMAGRMWWSIRSTVRRTTIVRCSTPEATHKALDVLGSVRWGILGETDDCDQTDAAREAATLDGVTGAWEGLPPGATVKHETPA